MFAMQSPFSYLIYPISNKQVQCAGGHNRPYIW